MWTPFLTRSATASRPILVVRIILMHIVSKCVVNNGYVAKLMYIVCDWLCQQTALWAQKMKHTFHQILTAKPINKLLKNLELPTFHYFTFNLAAF